MPETPLTITDPRFAPQEPSTSLSMDDIRALSGFTARGPIVRNLPRAEKSFEAKYANATSRSTGIPEDVLNALKALELRRAKGGKTVLGEAETEKAIRAAVEKSMPTPEDERSILDVPGNVVSDLKDIVMSIPRIPGALFNEAKRLTDLPSELAKVDDLADVTRLPGVAFLPGAYTLGNILEGTEGLEEAATHPLMTALDILPGAKAAAASTKVAKFAEAAAAERIAAGESIALNRANPIKTVLTKKLVEGADGPELANRVLGNVADMAGETRAAQAWQTAFGARTRANVAQPVNRANAVLQDLILSDKPIPKQFAHMTDAIEVARAGNGILAEGALKKYGIEPERIAQITSDMELNPAALDDLPANEQAWVDEYKAGRAKLDAYSRTGEFLKEIDGEMYTADQAKALGAARSRWNRKVYDVQTRSDRLFGRYVNHGYATAKEFRENFNPDGDGSDWTPELIEQIPAGLRPAFDAYQEWIANPTPDTRMAYQKKLNGVANGRTFLGSSSNVGKGGESAKSTLAEFQNLRKEVGKMAKRDKELDRIIVPARFAPKIQQIASENYIAQRFGHDPALVDRATDLYKRGLLDQMEGFNTKRDPMSPGWYDFIDRAAPMWKQLKEEGFDPIFVHRVAADQAERMSFPRVAAAPLTESQYKTRVLDMTPGVQDATVALQHEAIEILKKNVTDDVIATIADKVAVPLNDVRARYATRARRAAEANPLLNEGAHLDNLMRKTYEPYRPGHIFGGGEKLTASGGPELWIRKTDAQALRAMFNPKQYGIFSTIEPITGAMRTSVLGLSPRWHVNNILGGAIMVGVEGGWGVWKHAPEAWRAVKQLMAGEDPGLPPDFVASLGGMQRDAAEFQVRAGATMRRMVDQARHGDDVGAAPLKSPGPIREGFNKVVGGSYRLNQKFDDFYRAMAYLDGTDTALTKGLSREEAIRMGMQQATRTLQDMTELTAFEQSVMRQIFPFYNFYQHLLRFAFRYPMDHPARVAVTAAIARSEVENLGGLPRNFLEAFTWGDPDEEGNRKGFSLGGFNPYGSVGDLFTLAGWLGSSNPVAKTIFQQLGLDTMSGEPELFPQLTYDPAEGGLKIQTDNPVMQLIANTIPQSQIALELIGAKGDFKDMQSKNPEAAARLLRSQMGLPILYRTYNPDQKRMTAELDRQESVSKEESRLLKAGDLETIATDPRFAEVAAELAKHQEAGTLDSLRPNIYRPSMQQMIAGALGGQFGVDPFTPEERDAYNAQASVIAQTPGNNVNSR